jgi:hypothetical protein
MGDEGVKIWDGIRFHCGDAGRPLMFFVFNRRKYGDMRRKDVKYEVIASPLLSPLRLSTFIAIFVLSTKT